MHLRSKTVQQLLSVILSIVMVLSMLPMEVLAQETPPVTTPMDLTAITEDTSGDGWSWTQSTKTLTLTGLTLTVSDDSTHALILPDGATIDLADGTASTLTGGSRSTVYSSGEVKLRGSGSLTVYGRGWRSATLDMFIPGHAVGVVLKTDEGTEGAAICANVTLDNGILRATVRTLPPPTTAAASAFGAASPPTAAPWRPSSPPAPAMPAMVCTSTSRAVAGATPGPWDWAR